MVDLGSMARELAPGLWAASQPARRAGKAAVRVVVGPHLLRRRFQQVTGHELDEGAASTFTELVFVRMITQHRRPDPRMTRLSDKLQMREYVRQIVGDSYVVPLLWHGRDPSLIPFDRLPDRYVLKSNHACDQVLRVPSDSTDRRHIVETTRAWLDRNYYWAAREPQYYGIEPAVLVEPYLQDGYTDGPLDYRFFCFGGEPALIQVSDHRHAVHLFFDCDWTPVEVSCREATAFYPVARPTALPQMIEVASALSAEFDFVRVDLYDVHGRPLVGELTFTPNAGTRPFRQPWMEDELGRRWRDAAGALAATH